MAEGEEQGGAPRQSPWIRLLQAAGTRLVPIVISASALVGFVAFAGAVIVWTRFFALKVPADQVVAAVPRSELVATGSSLLLLFGFFGVLAVLAMYLVDRGGRATPGLARGLLILLAIEAITAILIDAGRLDWNAVFAIGLFLVPLSAIFAATFLDQLTSIEDSLPTRDDETLEPNPRLLNSLKKGSPLVGTKELLALLLFLTAVTGAFALLGLREPEWLTIAGWISVGIALVLGAALTAPAVRTVWRKQRKYRRKKREADARQKEEKKAEEEKAKCEQDAATVRVNRARARLWKIRESSIGAGIGLLEGVRLRLGVSQHPTGAIPAEMRAERALRRYEAEESALRETRSGGAESGRLQKPRSNRLSFKARGVFLAVIAMGLGTWLPAAVLREPWVAVSLGAAAILTIGLWRVAALSKQGFLWLGLAVFLSVPLFGTLTLMARNLDDPQVQPVALIRNTDGPDEAIQGLYVTEGDDRVYFATVATEGCSDEIRAGSGRLLWVPKSELVAMSVGPLQSINDAARTSLEMAYALTPAIETPNGAAVNLRTEIEEADVETFTETGSKPDPRLENTGAAVRPTFGRGIHLTPDSASPNEVVRLQMSNPSMNSDMDGFGVAREGGTLRVGGVPAAIIKKTAIHARRAEFVKTEEGKVLPLDKEGLYREAGGGYEPLPPGDTAGHEFVKLSERSGVTQTYLADEAIDKDDADGVYLEIADRPESGGQPGRPEKLRLSQEVQVGKSGMSGVEPQLLRQAWGEDEIRFRVPTNASTGAVTVECEQLAGQPLLQVERPPEAGVTAQMLNPERLRLDSSLSSDEGGINARRWALDGQPRGKTKVAGKKASGPRGKESVVFGISPDLAFHRVRLAVEDADDEVDRATLYVLRVPRPRIAFHKRVPKSLERLGAALARGVRAEAPLSVEVHGYASPDLDNSTKGSLAGARAVVGRLLNAQTAIASELDDQVPVKIKAYGSGCDRAVQGRRHVDIFVMSEGVRLLSPRGCHPRKVADGGWRAAKQGDDEDGSGEDAGKDSASTG